MKKNIISTIFIVSIAFSAFAQIKVISDGRTYINGYRAADDYNNELSAQIYGRYGTYLSNGRLGFGDYGSVVNNGANVFIGEFGTNLDSDILQLHGKRGVYLTRGTGTSIGFYDVENGNRFTFNCDVYSYSTKLTSDERFKTHVQDLDSSLIKLNKLNGVSYYYNFPIDYNENSFEKSIKTLQSESSSESITNKERRDSEFFKYYDKEVKNPKDKRLGFLAQDLQKTFPELVEKDSSGYFYVDYVGLIPVIVEALKEQQTIINTQSNKIKELEKKIDTDTKKSSSQGDFKSTSIREYSNEYGTDTHAFLFQNSPNPFTYTTEIQYYIPQNAKNAVFYVFNLQGNLILLERIADTGKGSITIEGSTLEPGMYVYSLYIDDIEIDTKKMILTK